MTPGGDPAFKVPIDFYSKKGTITKRAVIFGYDSKKIYEFTNTEQDKDFTALYESPYVLQDFSACILPGGNRLIVTGGSNDKISTLGREKAVELEFYEGQDSELECKSRKLPDMS